MSPDRCYLPRDIFTFNTFGVPHVYVAFCVLSRSGFFCNRYQPSRRPGMLSVLGFCCDRDEQSRRPSMLSLRCDPDSLGITDRKRAVFGNAVSMCTPVVSYSTSLTSTLVSFKPPLKRALTQTCFASPVITHDAQQGKLSRLSCTIRS